MQKTPISIAHGHQWGEWQFDERGACLDYLPHNYKVPLFPQNLASQVFGCVRGVAAKSWGTKRVQLDLIKAYSEIFGFHPKFSKAFQSEITTREAAWKQLLANVRNLVREEGTDRQSWNKKLQEFFDQFKGL